METEIFQLADKGVTFIVAIVAIYLVYQLGKLITNSIPSLLLAAKDFIKVWQEFVSAINKNTLVTDKSFQQSSRNFEQSNLMLEELAAVNFKFNSHDLNALEATRVVKELIAKMEKDDVKHDDITKLLKQIVVKLEEFQEWDGMERRK